MQNWAPENPKTTPKGQIFKFPKSAKFQLLETQINLFFYQLSCIMKKGQKLWCPKGAPDKDQMRRDQVSRSLLGHIYL